MTSDDIEVQCLADAAAYIERYGWPRSRLEGWRCAPVPRVSNPAHWDPYWVSPHNEVARSPKYVLALVADYVQCKACSALRRLPGPLSRLAETAPDSLANDWCCTQNTWDPAVAYCNAAEEDKGAEIKPMSARIRAVLADLPSIAPQIPLAENSTKKKPRVAGKKKGRAAPATPQKPAKKAPAPTPKPKPPTDPYSICLEPIARRDATVLSCSHTFHAACLATLEQHGNGIGTTRRSVVVTYPLCRKRARGSRDTSVAAPRRLGL